MVKPTSVLYMALALVIGFGVGYLVFKGTPLTGVSSGAEQAPILKSKWDNETVVAWQAIVNGKLTARDDRSFILSNGEASITLPLATGTIFNDSRDFTKAVDFTSVPLGTIIKGFVNVDREKGIFGAGTYTVQFE